jgi:hypothetical protein
MLEKGADNIEKLRKPQASIFYFFFEKNYFDSSLHTA